VHLDRGIIEPDRFALPGSRAGKGEAVRGRRRRGRWSGAEVTGDIDPDGQTKGRHLNTRTKECAGMERMDGTKLSNAADKLVERVSRSRFTKVEPRCSGRAKESGWIERLKNCQLSDAVCCA